MRSSKSRVYLRAQAGARLASKTGSMSRAGGCARWVRLKLLSWVAGGNPQRQLGLSEPAERSAAVHERCHGGVLRLPASLTLLLACAFCRTPRACHTARRCCTSKASTPSRCGRGPGLSSAQPALLACSAINPCLGQLCCWPALHRLWIKLARCRGRPPLLYLRLSVPPVASLLPNNRPTASRTSCGLGAARSWRVRCKAACPRCGGASLARGMAALCVASVTPEFALIFRNLLATSQERPFAR